MIEQNRRGFLLGLGAALAAPAIIKVATLMPIKALPLVRGFDLAPIKGEGVEICYDGKMLAAYLNRHPQILAPRIIAFYERLGFLPRVGDNLGMGL